MLQPCFIQHYVKGFYSVLVQTYCSSFSATPDIPRSPPIERQTLVQESRSALLQRKERRVQRFQKIQDWSVFFLLAVLPIFLFL